MTYHASSEIGTRTDIEYRSLTLHPDGLPHGPRAGHVEAAAGPTRTEELAVRVHTHLLLVVASGALTIEDRKYCRS
jgi:homogentisate 1,2-dioxygenase